MSLFNLALTPAESLRRGAPPQVEETQPMCLHTPLAERYYPPTHQSGWLLHPGTRLTLGEGGEMLSFCQSGGIVLYPNHYLGTRSFLTRPCKEGAQGLKGVAEGLQIRLWG